MLLQRLAALMLAALLWLGVTFPAAAGGACVEKPPTPEEVRNAFNMAVRLHDYVEKSGAKLALVARTGADLSEHGLRYSHMGALLRDHMAGRWLFVHLLNHCGRETSAIFDEGLANFFLDQPFLYEAAILIPTPELQDRLLPILAGPQAKQWHNPAYSMIARPTATKYQNSNQWLLELVALAQSQIQMPAGSVTNRAQAQAYFAARGFRADTIRISDFRRFGASIARANVRFDDHSAEEASNRRYEVVSVRSVARYLHATNAVIASVVISLDQPPRLPQAY